MTLLTDSSLEMMFRRTSGNSSLSIWRNMGSRWEMVLTRVSRVARGLAWVDNVLFLAEDGGQPTNLGTQRGADML
jgi:hypothetical protein